jgi:hypothetical protein
VGNRAKLIPFVVAVHGFKGSPALCEGIFDGVQRLRDEIASLFHNLNHNPNLTQHDYDYEYDYDTPVKRPFYGQLRIIVNSKL